MDTPLTEEEYKCSPSGIVAYAVCINRSAGHTALVWQSRIGLSRQPRQDQKRRDRLAQSYTPGRMTH